jgi:microcompartment protein CcmK/EutM
MIIAEVKGNIVATQKLDEFTGTKLLIVQPLKLDGSARGKTMLAIDNIGAGEGVKVLIVQEGKSAMHLLGVELAPVEAAVVGIIDHYTVDGTTVQC